MSKVNNLNIEFSTQNVDKKYMFYTNFRIIFQTSSTKIEQKLVQEYNDLLTHREMSPEDKRYVN